MISFRYHVVSIVAVFLALTVGLVLGSSFLNQVAVDRLDKQVRSQKARVDADHKKIDDLDSGLHYRDHLLGQVAPQLVAGRLEGRRVNVVRLPGVRGTVASDCAAALRAAGARVVGGVTVRPKLFAKQPAKAAARRLPAGSVHSSGHGGPVRRVERALAKAVGRTAAPNRMAPPRTGGPTTPPASPSATSGTEHAARPHGTHGGLSAFRDPAPAARAALTSLRSSGVIATSGDPGAGAALVLVLTPAPDAHSGASDVRGRALDLVDAMRSAARAVVLGGPRDSARGGGLIKALRGDHSLAGAVSTVDTADTPAGRVAVVWSFAALLDGEPAGHYGVVDNTDGWLPKLPTPTASGAAPSS